MFSLETCLRAVKLYTNFDNSELFTFGMVKTNDEHLVSTFNRGHSKWTL